MVYQWKSGCRITGISAEVAAAECNRLEKEGRLTAENLLDENRAEDAPLHSAFEWDDSIAAEEYRRDQARYIIRCIVLAPEAEEKKAAPVRAYFTVQPTVYQSVDVILSSQDSRELLLRKALSELRAFQVKYAGLKRLAPVFSAIDEVCNEQKGA